MDTKDLILMYAEEQLLNITNYEIKNDWFL